MAESHATLTLVLVALIGGLLTYGLASQHFKVGYCSLTVESAEACSSTGGVVVAVSFRNTGSKTITSVRLEVDGRVLAETSEPIPPGKGGSLVAQNPPGVWVCGSKKTGALKVTYSDGSQASFLAAIPVTGSPFSQGGQQTGEKRVLFKDTFDEGLSGWSLWGYTQAFAIETDAHGKPAPSLHVYGNGPEGVKAGAAKTVSIQPGTTVVSLALTFDFNVHALPDKKTFPGNLWLRVEAGGAALYDEKIYEAGGADSGWKSAEAQIALPQPSPSSLTIIIYMVDQSSKLQEFWIDNVAMSI